MAGNRLDTEERLSRIVAIRREIAAAGNDLQVVMQIVVERSQSITSADGAMVNLLDGDMVETRAACGIADTVFGARRPLSDSVAKYAIESGQPILIEDTVTDPRINQALRKKVGDRSLICVPLFRGSEVIGTLNVLSRSDEVRLNEEDRQTLELLSVVLSAAVSQAAEFEARRAQAEALARFRMLFEGASIGIVRLGPNGRAVEANPAFEEMLGYTAHELGTMRFQDYMHCEDVDGAAVLFGDLIAGRRETFQLEARYRRKDDELVWAHVRAALEHATNGDPACAVAMIENITGRKHAEAELTRQSELNQHQALHDALTGLPNRVLFDERIDQAIRHAGRHGTRLAVLMMDLDRFKDVNDSQGHHAGDELLTEVAARVRRALRDSDTVARLGGDEFGILLPEPSSPDAVQTVVQRIHLALSRPISLQERPVTIDASIGIAMFPNDGDDSELLVKRADAAMYSAKRESATYALYDRSKDAEHRARRGMAKPPAPQ